MTEELLKWLMNQGVAVGIAVILLVRIENKLDQVISKLDQLAH